jgi:tetratricopeptide (TPR) repeat protein
VIELAPVFDYNLGQCYRQLGKYEDAIWHYERFLKSGRPGAELHVLVTGFLQQMRGELERKAMTQPPTDVAPAAAAVRTAERDRAPPPSTERSPVLDMSGGARWYSDPIGWGLVGGGILGGGAAAYLLMSAAGLRGEADRILDEEQRLELRDRSRSRNIAGIAASIGGAGLLVIGMTKLAIHGQRPRRAGASSWGIGAGYRGAVVICRF